MYTSLEWGDEKTMGNRLWRVCVWEGGLIVGIEANTGCLATI